MKPRHIRAIAVFGIVLVTLTGARGSRGGGCDDDSTSGSSSSGSGGFTSGGSHGDPDTDDGVTTGGGGVTAAPTPTAVPTPVDAMSDVEVDFCSIDPAAKNVRGQLLIDNTTAVSQTYDITVHFEGDTPASAPFVDTIEDITVAGNESYFTEASAPYSGSGEGTDSRKCKVVSATRTVHVG
ncbi:hypothetical protein [Streptomyces formicae]|uniref:Secreted protein n=1 Tax=Streptomyces formicae TaxID=1616117 RepID=A0ABY3WSY5_9ACTN|nr:hypothetical protein [Streptomyces formicae]UNM15763.1 hypothetical protein J4032_33710 [Streptomyces formicae]